MHEYAVVSELLASVEAEAERHGANRVHRVIVRLGELAGVQRELFATAFETFSDKTICENAELVIEPVAARWACPRCGVHIERGAILSCTKCQVAAKLVDGAQLLLQRIEMEVPDV